MTIGRLHNCWGVNNYTGLIDELSIYSRSLSPSEIEGIYNAGSAGKCSGGTPPTITSQPVNQFAVPGEAATFSVVAFGSQPLTYQWFFDNTNLIIGATNALLTLTNVQLSDAGTYHVTVTNAAGSVTSSNAALAVNPTLPCTPSGLVAWWQAEGNANDSVGTNNGTLLGGLSFTNGEVGQAFNFTNNSQGVQVNASPSLAAQSLTIEAWVNPTDVGNYRPIVEYGADTGPDPVDLAYGWTATGTTPGALYGVFRAGTLGSLQVSSIGGILPVNQWSHLALTFDFATLTAILYLNGSNVVVRVDAYPGTLTPSTALPVHIGYRPNTSSEAFAGARHSGGLDEVSIYNRTFLSQGEIQALYNAGSVGKCFVPVPPSITTQPTNQAVLAGSSGQPSPWPRQDHLHSRTNGLMAPAASRMQPTQSSHYPMFS